MTESSAQNAPAPDLWDRIGTLRWQHVVLGVVALACVTGVLIASFFAPPLSIRISSNPTTTTTEARHG